MKKIVIFVVMIFTFMTLCTVSNAGEAKVVDKKDGGMVSESNPQPSPSPKKVKKVQIKKVDKDKISESNPQPSPAPKSNK